MSGENSFITSFLFGMIAAYLFISGNQNIKEKTFYYYYCSDFEHSVYDCPKKVYASKTTYKIFIEQQRVVPEFINWYLKATNQCNVFDENNWYCKDEYNKGTSVYDGKIYHDSKTCVTKGKQAGDICFPVSQQTNYLHYKLIKIKNFMN